MNPIDQFNELHGKKSFSGRIKTLLIITIIITLGLTASYFRNKALNEEVIIVVGQITKVNPRTIYYGFPFDGSTLTGAFDFSSKYHLQRNLGDLLIIQVSTKQPKYHLVINKENNVNSTRHYGEVVKDMEPIKLKWWQH